MKPFRDYELRAIFEKRKQDIKKNIDSLSNEEILANDIEILIDNLYQSFYIEPVIIEPEDMNCRELKQIKIKKHLDEFDRKFYGKEYTEVDGVRLRCAYPFMGDELLFRCQASTYSLSGYPEIDICNGRFFLSLEKTLSEAQIANAREKMMAEMEHGCDRIRSAIEHCNNDVKEFNSGLKGFVRKLLEIKRKNVEKFFSLATALTIPVTKTSFTETHIKVNRKVTPIAHEYKRENYYLITSEDYEDILEVIRHTAITFERAPGSYKLLGEEALRDILLASLNGSYQGNAIGEAFRNKGKTDIMIERENRAAFVAECKVWTGQHSVESAIKQLDGYLTWRDRKTALIYFVRRKDFSKTLESMESALSDNTMIEQIKEIAPNEFKCTVKSESNVGQLTSMRVLMFNIYSD